MVLLRRGIDDLYRSSRGLEDGLDQEVSSRDLFEFLATKAVWRLRGAVRRLPGAFVGPSVSIKSRKSIRIGRRVSLGRGVTLEAAGGGLTLGNNVTIDKFASLKVSGVLRNLGVGINIGDRSSVGMFNVIQGQGGVWIGRDVLIGPGVSIVSENHSFDRRDVPIREQGENRKPIIIEDGVWVGANVTVLAGVRVGTGAIVAAGAVVNADVDPYHIVGGVPARTIRVRPGGDNA